jgi:DNA-binding LytR/AlgR family response regulator
MNKYERWDFLRPDSWVLLRDGHRDSAVVTVSDIIRIIAVRNNLIVTVASVPLARDITVRAGTLVKLVERLPTSFISLGRSCVINMRHVASVNALSSRLSFTMCDGLSHEASRVRSRAIRNKLTL